MIKSLVNDLRVALSHDHKINGCHIFDIKLVTRAIPLQVRDSYVIAHLETGSVDADRPQRHVAKEPAVTAAVNHGVVGRRRCEERVLAARLELHRPLDDDGDAIMRRRVDVHSRGVRADGIGAHQPVHHLQTTTKTATLDSCDMGSVCFEAVPTLWLRLICIATCVLLWGCCKRHSYLVWGCLRRAMMQYVVETVVVRRML